MAVLDSYGTLYLIEGNIFQDYISAKKKKKSWDFQHSETQRLFSPLDILKCRNFSGLNYILFDFFHPWKVGGYQAAICQTVKLPNSCCGLYGKHQAICKAARKTQSKETS